MYIDGTTARYALLGEKLGHTHSPFIHHALYRAAGVNAVYLPMPCAHETLSAMMAVMRDTFSGFNVTIPYKEAVLPYLDVISDKARAMGSVNTVRVEQGRMSGFSTDGEGFLYAMAQANIPVDNAQATIIGYGGTARAIAWELLEKGCRVSIIGRDPDKAKAFAAEMSERSGKIVTDRGLEFSDILVNTTPVGMHPNIVGIPVEEEMICRSGAVFDAIYNPLQTEFLQIARRCGIPAVGGLPMLFGQAIAAQKHMGLPAVQAAELDKIYSQLEECAR